MVIVRVAILKSRLLLVRHALTVMTGSCHRCSRRHGRDGHRLVSLGMTSVGVVSRLGLLRRRWRRWRRAMLRGWLPPFIVRTAEGRWTVRPTVLQLLLRRPSWCGMVRIKLRLWIRLRLRWKQLW